MKNTTKEIYMYVLGAIIVIGSFVTVGISMVKEIPGTNHDIVVMGIGQLLGMCLMVAGYFYGSSKGSSDKTNLLEKNKNGELPKEP